MTSRRAPRVWVDTDVALGSAAGDVDDGFALAALVGAARKGRIELLGISTVSGNCTAPEAERCARTLLEAASAPALPVIRGGSSAREAGAAGEALAALPDETRLVAIGPLSNVAAAVALDPEMPRRVRIAVVGGNLTSRGFLPPLWPHEFNLAKDRASARSALAAPWLELVLHPLDVLRRFRCDASRLETVAEFGEPGRLLARESVRWLVSTRWRFGSGGFPVWDLVPALVAADALEVAVEERRFPAVQRAYSGIPPRARAAVDFDPRAAWTAFGRLVEVFR